jgi:pyridinium-3,5-biscarboxylic acid mononucleotide synthase
MGVYLPERAKYTMADPVDERTWASVLQRVADGERTVDEALSELRDLPFEDIGSARIDHHRELRTGQAEAVYAPGKTREEVRDAAVALLRRAAGAVFVTRADPEQFRAVQAAIPGAAYDERSRLVVVQRVRPNGHRLGSVAVLTGGTADLPVAEEAALTASALGLGVDRVFDVGVAGVHRLLAERERIEAADCLVVIAGMEGALPSVVAGLTSRPVVAVPTSVGYGASFQGLAALLTMLASCAPGVAVVNIDNGFGAALVAHRILRAGRAGT